MAVKLIEAFIITIENNAVGFCQQLLDHIKKVGYGTLATVVGRYYAMDRDKRWERIQIAYEALIVGKGEKSSTEGVIDAIKAHYANDETDEFLKPIIINEDGRIRGLKKISL